MGGFRWWAPMGPQKIFLALFNAETSSFHIWLETTNMILKCTTLKIPQNWGCQGHKRGEPISTVFPSWRVADKFCTTQILGRFDFRRHQAWYIVPVVEISCCLLRAVRYNGIRIRYYQLNSILFYNHFTSQRNLSWLEFCNIVAVLHATITMLNSNVYNEQRINDIHVHRICQPLYTSITHTAHTYCISTYVGLF